MKSDISVILKNIQAEDEHIRNKALVELKDVVAPWELLDGYGSTTELMRISKDPVTLSVIPLLIALLKDDACTNKSFVLETLYDLARYKDVGRDFIPKTEYDRYMKWAKDIRSRIRQDLEVYTTLLQHPLIEVRQEAQALINLLKGD